MADDFVQVAPNSSGNKIDASSLTVSANTVDRQRVNVSSPTQANNHAEVGNSGLYVTQVDGAKATYSGAVRGLVPAATPTDIFTISGSATTVVRILRIVLSATQTTGGMIDVLLIKRSSIDTAGTPAAVTAVPHDSSSPAATAVVQSWTANPTLGGTVGTIRAEKLWVPVVTAAGQTRDWDFGNGPRQGIVLRGATQQLAVNLNSITLTGGLVDISIEFTEE